MTRSDLFTRWIHPYLDNELEPEQKEAVRAHLGECSLCASEYRAMTALVARLKETKPAPDMPSELKSRILRSLPRQVSAPSARLWPRVALALAASMLLILGISLFSMKTPPGRFPTITERDPSAILALDSMRDHHEVSEGNLPLERFTSDPRDLAGFFLQSHELSFNKGMFPEKQVPGVLLLGGRLHWLHGKRSAYLVFQKGNEKVSLQIVDGHDVRLPPGRKVHKGNRMLVCSGHDCCRCISWKDSGTNTACFLVSHLPEGEMLDLASVMGP
ncbi:MAG: zf-HC2 domain-containing protein [Armatimonadetes bacterium]|nr:zf-HC2 domain-containing protein [Armatimonadota bacterium]